MYFFQILKLEEDSRTKLFCSAILFQLQNLEKKFRVGGKNLGYVGQCEPHFFGLIKFLLYSICPDKKKSY